MKRTTLLPLICLLLLSAKCNKTPDVDFCEGKTPFVTDFNIEEKVGDTSFVTDKALAPGYVFFNATGKYDSVEWVVGGAQNYSTRQQYTLYFDKPMGPVRVTFIGHHKPDTQCFPEDDGIDTVEKTLTVLPRDEKAPIMGNFLGYNEKNPSDTFTVSISYDAVDGYLIKNLPKGCPGYTTGSEEYPHNIGLIVAGGASGFRIDDGSRACSNVKGIGNLIGSDSLVVTYSYYEVLSTNPYDYSDTAISKKFIGIRKP